MTDRIEWRQISVPSRGFSLVKRWVPRSRRARVPGRRRHQLGLTRDFLGLRAEVQRRRAGEGVGWRSSAGRELGGTVQSIRRQGTVPGLFMHGAHGDNTVVLQKIRTIC